jgi:hypothetical protein
LNLGKTCVSLCHLIAVEFAGSHMRSMIRKPSSMGIAGVEPRQLAPTVGTMGSGSTDLSAASPTTIDLPASTASTNSPASTRIDGSSPATAVDSASPTLHINIDIASPAIDIDIASPAIDIDINTASPTIIGITSLTIIDTASPTIVGITSPTIIDTASQTIGTLYSPTIIESSPVFAIDLPSDNCRQSSLMLDGVDFGKKWRF